MDEQQTTPAPESTTAPVATPAAAPAATNNDVEQNKVMAALGYVLFFIPLLAAPNSSFAKYHANQGLILLIVAIGSNIILPLIPILGWILWPIVELAVFVLFIMGIINAMNGQEKPLPLIGQFTIIK